MTATYGSHSPVSTDVYSQIAHKMPNLVYSLSTGNGMMYLQEETYIAVEVLCTLP